MPSAWPRQEMSIGPIPLERKIMAVAAFSRLPVSWDPPELSWCQRPTRLSRETHN